MFFSLYGNVVGQCVYYHSIKAALEDKKKPELALQWYDRLIARMPPTPEICSLLLQHHIKKDEPERALWLFEGAVKQGMPRYHPITQNFLIQATAKRRHLYGEMWTLVRQLDTHGMGSATSAVYASILEACGRVGDLQSAMCTWRFLQRHDSASSLNQLSANKNIVNNIRAVNGLLLIDGVVLTNMLYCLAAIDTDNNKISVRRNIVHSKLKGKDLVGLSTKILSTMLAQGHVKMHPRLLHAYLAVACSHKMQELAERIFFVEFEKYGCGHSRPAIDIMMRMWDSVQRYEKAKALREWARQQNIALGLDAYRSLIRCAALSNKLDEAMCHLGDMITNVYGGKQGPPHSSMRLLHLKIFEAERWDLHYRLVTMLDFPKPVKKNPMSAWRVRAEGLNEIFEHLYGHLPRRERPRINR